jgi:cell cycle sensor histidine kinase DivJ
LSSEPGIFPFTAALLHPSVVSAPERVRQRSFMGQALAVAFTALAAAPIFLAFRGVPTPAEMLIFMCCLGQLVAAMLVARTGHLALGQSASFASLVGASLTLSFALHAGAACALAWLVPAQMEAMQSGGKTMARIGAAVTIAAACLILAAGTGTPASASDGAALLTGFAVAQALFTARRPLETIAGMAASERRQSERWRAISEALGDAIVGFGSDGSVHQVTSECERLFGATHADLAGRAFFDHVHVCDRPRFLKLIADTAHGNVAGAETIRLRAWDRRLNARGFEEPRHLWIEVRARKLGPVPTDDAERAADPASVVAVLRDVTTIREHDLEIDAARQTVEAAIQSKDHFLANMSHELRTPLNAIIGFSEMLGSRTLCPSDPEKQRGYACIINQSGQHLLSVVNSILDMSKIQSGTFSIIPEPFEPAPLIDLCCDMVALKAEESGIRFVRDYAATLEPLVGDKRACKQILINLLSNAVKFTPQGGQVTVRARPEGNALVLCVADTGIGIAPADLPRLGDAFFQALPTLSRPFEGTGLGLSVVRGLVGLHGGAIAVESEVGKGTLVTIRLPLDCRIVTSKPTTAAIDTIARRQPAERFFHETRMKKIA